RRGKEPLCTGPARLCQALGITGKLNGVSLQRGLLRIVKGTKPKAGDIVTGPRIGITQAADWRLRRYIKDSPWIPRQALREGVRVRLRLRAPRLFRNAPSPRPSCSQSKSNRSASTRD